MWQTNPTWGSPRIVAELRKLGIHAAKSTVEKYQPRQDRPGSPTWTTFLDQHVKDLVSIDFLFVPTATLRVLFVFVVLAHDRRRIVHFIEEVVTAPASPWQNAYVERVIGSFRRELLDHVIILNERHLKRLLSSYLHYYHPWRTHRSLDRDAPDGRPVRSAEPKHVTELPAVQGLHHYYLPKAA
jgi:hypothetical protein